MGGGIELGDGGRATIEQALPGDVSIIRAIVLGWQVVRSARAESVALSLHSA